MLDAPEIVPLSRKNAMQPHRSIVFEFVSEVAYYYTKKPGIAEKRESPSPCGESWLIRVNQKQNCHVGRISTKSSPEICMVSKAMKLVSY